MMTSMATQKPAINNLHYSVYIGTSVQYQLPGWPVKWLAGVGRHKNFRQFTPRLSESVIGAV